jgi:hypothetical protein
MPNPEDVFDIEPILYKYNDSIIKVIQYQPNKFLEVLKLFFAYVINNPEMTFSVIDVAATNSKRLTFKYTTSSVTNILNLHDYLVVKTENDGDLYLEAIPQTVLESQYTVYDGSPLDPPSGDDITALTNRVSSVESDVSGLQSDVNGLTSNVGNKIPKDFVNKIWDKGVNGDNWWITAMEVVAHPTDPTTKANVQAHFADALTNNVKTETFTLELGTGLEFTAGSTTNSIKINLTNPA